MSLAESKQVENSEKLKFYNFNQRILDVITFCITLLACELFSNKQTAAELKPFKKIPLLSEVQSICVTLMEKLLEKEFPLLTTVKVIGLLVARPISTYTEKDKAKT